MDRIPPPEYRTLTGDMGFDPGEQFDGLEWVPWDLEKTYPLTVGELVGSIGQRIMPTLIEQMEEDDEGGTPSDAGGGGPAVPSGPQDGDPVGGIGQDRVDQDPGGAPALS